MAKAKLNQTKGISVKMNFGVGKVPAFIAGGKKRFLIEEEWGGMGIVMVNGEVKDGLGNRYYALLEMDECSSGEYYGGYYFEATPNGVELKELSKLGPHKYKYHANVKCCRNHHIGDDGWSV